MLLTSNHLLDTETISLSPQEKKNEHTETCWSLFDHSKKLKIVFVKALCFGKKSQG